MEFPPSDPPQSFVPVNNYVPSGSYAPPSVNYSPVANYTSYESPQPVVNHPSYEEMVRSAIVALNEKDGSSRQAIAKYIETYYKIVPSQTHGYELTQQLKRMKSSGQLVLNKHSYMFPGSISVPAATVNGASDAMTHAQAQVSDVLKRKPGRPPKLQPNGGLMGLSARAGFENHQVGGAPGFGVPTSSLFGGLNSGDFQFVGGNGSNDVTVTNGGNGTNDVTVTVSDVVTAPVTVSNVVTAPVPVSNAPTMVNNGGAKYDPGAVANVVPLEQTDVAPVKRGRGRPRKVHTLAVGNGSGAIVVSAGEDSVAQNIIGNGALAEATHSVLGKRRQGRPAKLRVEVTGPVVNGGAKEGQGGRAMVPVEGKRGRGRPRKNAVGATGATGGVAKKPKKVSGKTSARPRKNALQTASLMSEMQLMAYEGLKARVEHYQSRIKTAINVVKPYLNETAVIAIGALQDLEELASMDIISVPISVQGPPVDVQGVPVKNVQSADVLSAPVDLNLNAPVNVPGTAPENTQSAPFTAEAMPSTGETTHSTFQSAPVAVQGQ